MDNLLVRIHFIIVMIRWTGLARYGTIHVDAPEIFCVGGWGSGIGG